MSADALAPEELQVLVAAPTRRDGEVTRALLSERGVDCTVVACLQEAVDAMGKGVGALLLTDAVLADRAMTAMSDALQRQPSWSDIPTILLTRHRAQSPSAVHALARMTNVTLLDRPSSTRSLVSAVQAALRARRRQYQIRDQLIAQREAEAALVDADKRKDEFLATLAHELRNPLAAIRAGLELVVRHPEEAQRTERMALMMGRQTGMLVKLIDDLMDVSRISTGKVGLAHDRLDLRAVTQAGLEGQAVFDASRHAISLELSDAPVWIDGDGLRLAQVVGNLVNNAAKYTPHGGRIAIVVATEAGEAVVRVVDGGVGIPPEMLEQVFEMFAQVDRTLDRAQGGLGIGLSLVRRLVELHGGRVTAESAGVGHGSTFTVRLPLAAAMPPGSAVAEPVPTAGRASRALRIVVVDDNRDVADGLAALLSGDGHEVSIAYGGADGLERTAVVRPDIVFCDIGMPGMSGLAFAAKLRADPAYRSVLLIAVTGWGTDQDKRLCDAAGFDCHFTKPVSLEDVGRVLARF